MNQMLRRS
jgi:hypothetical protein